MMEPAIRIESLSKAYRLGTLDRQRWYADMRRLARSAWRHVGSMGRCDQPDRRQDPDERLNDSLFWALRDVTFDVAQGEVVGLVGRNGAGKSTLLKILSRITEPTLGEAEINGRVGSLLEVGTGFHPELTGRDNIFMNGTILGMRKWEIDKKFDEIVEFAGVGRYLDTPVKRYSSGMRVRLAFAVAAHLDPEILLVDEVLAVGDAAFQEKCIGKMHDVVSSGRTIVFVSHNMAAVQQLCGRCVVMEGGHIACIDTTDRAIRYYLEAVCKKREGEERDWNERRGNQALQFVRVELLDEKGRTIKRIMSGEEVRIRLHYKTIRPMKGASIQVAFNVKNQMGWLLLNLNSMDSGLGPVDLGGVGFFECVWPRVALRSGRYDCDLFCSIHGDISDWIENAFVLNVEDGNFFGTGRMMDRNQGELLVDHSWRAIS